MNLFLMAPYIEITTSCNLRCLHCYNESGSQEAMLLFKDMRQIHASLEKAGLTSITLSGGEPMLHPNFVEFVKYFGDKGYSITVVTNAANATNGLLEQIKKYNMNFQVSLNGSRAITHDKLCGTGAFNKTMLGLESLITYFGDNISIHSMVVNYNKNDLYSMVEFVCQLGIKTISFASPNKLGRAVANGDEFLLPLDELLAIREHFESNPRKKEYEDKGMDISFTTYSDSCPFLGDGEIGISPRIDPFGYVYLCQSFNNYSFGNIRETGLYELIKYTSSPVDLIDKIQKARGALKKCCSCVWQFECGRGCPADAVMNCGNIYGEDRYCAYRKIEFFNQLKRNVNV